MNKQQKKDITEPLSATSQAKTLPSISEAVDKATTEFDLNELDTRLGRSFMQMMFAVSRAFREDHGQEGPGSVDMTNAEVAEYLKRPEISELYRTVRILSKARNRLTEDKNPSEEMLMSFGINHN